MPTIDDLRDHVDRLNRMYYHTHYSSMPCAACYGVTPLYNNDAGRHGNGCHCDEVAVSGLPSLPDVLATVGDGD